MKIGSAADESGLPARTIRYYEDIGLLNPSRAENGYRDYSEADVHKLRFLQRSRSLGFTIEECRSLLSLYENTGRASADVKAIAEHRIEIIDCKIGELKSLRKTLSHLASTCHGDEKPDCPILDSLACDAVDRRGSGER